MKLSVVALASAAAVGVAQAAEPALSSSFDVYKIRSDGLCVETTLSAQSSLDLISTGFREGACRTAGFTEASSTEANVFSLPEEGAALDYAALFSHFQSLHGKVYAGEAEAAKRLAPFSRNVDAMLAHNRDFAAGKTSFWMGLTPFADLSVDEYRRKYLKLQTTRRGASALSTFDASAVTDAPASWDWSVRPGSALPVLCSGGDCLL